MPNLYGVDNGPTNPVFYFALGAADVVCAAGVETTVMQAGPLIAPNPGFWYPVVQFSCVVGLGATIPTATQWGLRVLSGADMNSIGVNNNQYVANAQQFCSYFIWGTPSDSLYRSPGTTIQLTMNAQGQPVTVRYNGGYYAVWLWRAADQ